MAHSSRRGVLRGGLAATVGLGTFGWGPSGLAAREPVAVPETPMRLSRDIERDLARGERLSIGRSWRIAFARTGRGIAVTGRQIAARVEAPGPFDALAGIEERRSTMGMWPILLSDEGTIVGAGAPEQEQELAEATREAERLIAGRRLPADEAALQRAFLAELQEIGGSLLGQWPGDLFFPSEVPVRESGEMTLPNGLSGTFELTWIAARAQGRDWLGEGTRSIVTRIGSDARRALETWRMEPA